jgi:phosphate-selective porin
MKVQPTRSEAPRATCTRPAAIAAFSLALLGLPATAPAQTASPAPAAEAPPPAAPAPAAAPLKFSGLLQAWYLAGDDATTDSFRIRRVELKSVGQVGPRVAWTVMIDVAKSLSVNQTTTTVDGTPVVTDTSINQASRVLQDAFISLRLDPRLQVDVGQLKVPMGGEGLASSAALETVERALFMSDRARGGTFGDIRDVGAVLRYTPHPSLDVIAGAFNGSGESQNDLDRNDQKAFSARVAFRPAAVPGLQLGMWAVEAGETVPGRPQRDRRGLELQWVRGDLTARAELVEGADGAITRRGYYGLVAYRLRPQLSVVGRFDSWDPNVDRDADAASVRERDLVAGVSYLFENFKARLQMNYLNKEFSGSALPGRDLLIVNLQTSW